MGFLIAAAALGQQFTVEGRHSLASAVEPRTLSIGGKLIARGIDVNEVVGERIHFFSHAEAIGGSITEVDSWSDREGNPIHATYRLWTKNFWTVTEAKFDHNEVTLNRASNNKSFEKTVKLVVPEGKRTLLAQFDPLRLFGPNSAGGTINVAIVDVSEMTVLEGAIDEVSNPIENRLNRVFSLVTTSVTNQILVSTEGRVMMVKNSLGQVYEPAEWDRGFKLMAQRAGIGLEGATFEPQIYSTTRTAPTVVRRKIN